MTLEKFSFIIGLIGFLSIGFLVIRQILFIIQNKSEFDSYNFWKEVLECIGLFILVIGFAAIMSVGISHIFY